MTRLDFEVLTPKCFKSNNALKMKYDYPHPIKIWKRQKKLKAIEGEKEEKMSVGKRMKNAVAFKKIISALLSFMNHYSSAH